MSARHFSGIQDSLLLFFTRFACICLWTAFLRFNSIFIGLRSRLEMCNILILFFFQLFCCGFAAVLWTIVLAWANFSKAVGEVAPHLTVECTEEFTKSCGYKTSINHQSLTTVLNSCYQVFVSIYTFCFSFICGTIMAKHLHIDLTCPQVIFPRDDCSDVILQTWAVLVCSFYNRTLE